MKKLRRIIREELLNEAGFAPYQPPGSAVDYEEASYQMDKWLPNDMDVIDEFDQYVEARDLDSLANLLESEASDEVAAEYGITTTNHFRNLAKHILSNS